MSDTRGLMDFAGAWRVDRVIRDARAVAEGRFEGEACLTPDDQGLTYVEDGQMRLGAGPVMTATRRYLWRPAASAIDVFFDDGRFFHRFDPAAGQVTAAHWCDPDQYDVAYDFSHWPSWQSTWTVTGPRKDYVMSTRYSRL